MTGQQVRIGVGEFVIARHTLRSVVTHLEMLVRHLEQLIPSDEDIELQIRARTFKDAFADKSTTQRTKERRHR